LYHDHITTLSIDLLVVGGVNHWGTVDRVDQRLDGMNHWGSWDHSLDQRSGGDHSVEEGSSWDDSLDQRSGMDHWSGMNNWSSMNHWGGVGNWHLAHQVHVALVGDGRGCAGVHVGGLGHNSWLDNRMGLGNQTRSSGGHGQAGEEGNLQMG